LKQESATLDKMLKSILKSFIPESVMQARRQRIALRRQSEYAVKEVEETFSEIYEKNVWGGRKGEFYSGEGSTEKYADAYAECVRKIIFEKRIRKVVDLGCGDFRVASKFITPEIEYVGIDVVPSLINHNQIKFGKEKIRFLCANIIDDELPEGELCLIRQVLQHLSNAEIRKILENVRKFRYLIVTEHFPHPTKKIVANLDIPHGPEMRLHFDSAVILDEPPFGLEDVKLLLDSEAEEGTRLKSFLIEQA
jgi:SAM-dependent methyltransferase